MAQFMVINLDEFNQISPQVQQGFLKNLIQLPTLKYKPPYGSHVMEFPYWRWVKPRHWSTMPRNQV